MTRDFAYLLQKVEMQTKSHSHAAYLRPCALHGYLTALPALPSSWRACALPCLIPSGEQVCAQLGGKGSTRIEF